MDENFIEKSDDQTHEVLRDETINISDVIEVIETTDPDFKQSTMYNGGREVPGPSSSRRPQAYVKIVEQPAPKALRFRYECEGRSAGSIPGARSTPDNKTYPTIKIMGYVGKAIVVVSCVTKDEPYKPHPHNLVGREGCRKGVCTLAIGEETMTATFQNLGIQCVKKKDIEAALKVREEIRVDPFRTGFGHRNQPAAIDLNAVRLCFQVFLEDSHGKFTIPLTPVVSDVIYDKKAMSDLIIVKLSQCVCCVDGGTNDIIILCEKVAKEDIEVRFFEKQDSQIVWEARGDFQPSQVHKQTAIWFRPPRYRTLEITEPVKVFIQLRRPSDGATSEALPFQYLPLDSGRPAYWSYRRNLAKKANYTLFNTILEHDAQLLAKRQLSNVPSVNGQQNNVAKPAEETAMVVETNNNTVPEWCNYTEIKKGQSTEEKSFNELINQVAELDEIYSDTQARLLNSNLSDISQKPTLEHAQGDSFDDARTYSSLQLAFKNPIDITEEVISPASPVIDLGQPNKRDSVDVEKLPPLPPKRAKKIETAITGSTHSIQLSGKQAENILHGGSLQNVRTVTVGRSQSFNLPRPRSQNELSPPVKRLPATPSSTLPNPKKRGFFSRLFGRKSKTPGGSRDSSVLPSKRNSFSSSKSLQVGNNSLARSASNLSTRSYGDATSIHIPLKGTPPGSTDNLTLPPNAPNLPTLEPQNVETVMCLDLTEAEHYALYMAMAPHATQSEFDEFSCYYAPVEGGKILTDAELLAKLNPKT